MNALKIGIIDDYEVNRRMLKKALANYVDFSYEVVLENESLYGFPDYHPAEAGPDLIFLDIDMPGISRVEGVTLLMERYPRCKIIMFTDTDDMSALTECFNNGAKGYLKKKINKDELLCAILVVKNDGVHIDPLLWHM